MSEPTNPLFEEEKAFLERKKLEYERALRGDVAHLKEQTANVGRYALVGGGLVGSIWLITKVLGGRKRKKQRDRYADYDADDYDQQDYDYPTQYFADAEFGDEADGHTGYSSGRADYDYADQHYNDRWQDDAPDYFADEDESHSADQNHGAVYHSDSDSYDDPRGAADSEADLDDNGLHDYPGFPAHSSKQHGDEATASDDEAERFESEAYGHPDSTLPFDDSRRLPESNEFTGSTEHTDDQPAEPKKAAKPSRNLGSMLVSFATSGLGKMLLGQAASVGMALATKAIKSKLEGSASDTANTSDLAAQTDQAGGDDHGHSATPQPDATTAPADSDFDDTSRA